MPGIEYRLGRTDHRIAEDFLGSSPENVAGILLEAKNLRFQQDVAEAARTAEVQIFVEPLTERLMEPGFDPSPLDYWNSYPIRRDELESSAARAEFVERVVEPQLKFATVVVPPHFFVEDERVLALNIALVRQAVATYGADFPIRPILAVQRTFLAEGSRAAEVASQYRRTGVTSIDLRLSPLGGEHEGPRKVRSSFSISAAFRDAGLAVIMGSQGNIGHVALALGLIERFSVGIGYRESYNYKQAINRQGKASAGGDGRFGPRSGVYLPEAAITIPRRIAEALYQDRQIRTRLACREGACAEAIDGPTRDPRGHYLHARTSEIAATLARPLRWRPMLERDRLTRAVEMRTILDRHLPSGTPSFSSRTLRTLIGELEATMSQAESA